MTAVSYLKFKAGLWASVDDLPDWVMNNEPTSTEGRALSHEADRTCGYARGTQNGILARMATQYISQNSSHYLSVSRMKRGLRSYSTITRFQGMRQRTVESLNSHQSTILQEVQNKYHADWPTLLT